MAVLGRKFNIFQAHSGSGALDMLDQAGPDLASSQRGRQTLLFEGLRDLPGAWKAAEG